MKKIAFNTAKNGLLALCLLSLNGCGLSWFSERDTNPLIQGTAFTPPFFWNDQQINTYATKASHRMAIIRVTDKQMTMCAEPSPDVGEAFASNVADALKLSLKNETTKSNMDVNNDYSRAVTTQIASLINRTQGLQLYRNAVSDLCMDRLNGWINDKAKANSGNQDLTDQQKYEINLTYAEMKQQVLKNAVELIKEELKYQPLKPIPSTTPESSSSGSPGFSFESRVSQVFSKKDRTGEITVTVGDIAKDETISLSVEGGNIVSASDIKGAAIPLSDDATIALEKKTPITLKIQLKDLQVNGSVKITAAGTKKGKPTGNKALAFSVEEVS